MAKNNSPKKDNPLLAGILMTVVGIVMFFAGKGRDLMLFHSIRIDGRIAFPILGVLAIAIGVYNLVQYFKNK